MKWTSWAFLAFLGSLAFLVLFIADRQMNAGVPVANPIVLTTETESRNLSVL